MKEIKQFPEEEKTEEVKVKESKKDIKTLVVAEYPSQQIRDIVAEDGNEYHLVDINTALTEILETIRLLKKGLI